MIRALLGRAKPAAPTAHPATKLSLRARLSGAVRRELTSVGNEVGLVHQHRLSRVKDGTAHLAVLHGEAQTVAEAREQITYARADLSTAREIPGAVEGVPNYVIDAPGKLELPKVMADDPAWLAIHKGDLNRRLNHEEQARAFEFMIGSRLLKADASGEFSPEHFVDELTDEQIIKICALFGHYATHEMGREYFVELAKRAWRGDTLEQALDAAEAKRVAADVQDQDDTRVSSHHVGRLDGEYVKQAANHFAFKDKRSAQLSGDPDAKTWGDYEYMAQQKAQIFFAFRKLRHDVRMNAGTDSDRNFIYNNALYFRDYAYALLDAMPYQQVTREEVQANVENIRTTREHAEDIRALTERVHQMAGDARDIKGSLPGLEHIHPATRDRWVKGLPRKKYEQRLHRKAVEAGTAEQVAAPVFDQLDDKAKMSIALLLFGTAGIHTLPKYKPHKNKNSWLARLNDVRVAFAAKVRVDNSELHGIAGMMLGTETFVAIEDRHTNPVVFYGSTLVMEALSARIQRTGETMAAFSPNFIGKLIYQVTTQLAMEVAAKGTLNELPGRNYSDIPMLDAIARAQATDDSIKVDLTEISQGVSGITIQRERNATTPFEFLGQGYEANFARSKAEIEQLRALMRYIGEYEAIRRYFWKMAADWSERKAGLVA
jgi:hypothetical protein